MAPSILPDPIPADEDQCLADQQAVLAAQQHAADTAAALGVAQADAAQAESDLTAKRDALATSYRKLIADLDALFGPQLPPPAARRPGGR